MSALSLLLPLLLTAATPDRLGRYVPLETVLADALRRYPGQLVEVELDGDKYEIEILGANGVVMELDYDAASGRLLKMEED